MTLLERIKQANSRPPPEEDIWVRVSVLIAVTTAALAVVDQGIGGPVFRLAVVGGLPVAYWYSWRTRDREGLGRKAVVALGAIAALAWFITTIAPQAGGTFADAQAPLAELLLMIQVLHGLDVPGRRDLLFSLLSSAVLMAFAGALSTSMALVPYLIVWGVAAASALVLAHRSELTDMATLGGETRHGGHRDAVRPVVKVVALSIATGLAFFSVLPPGGTSRSLLFPSQILKLLPIPSAGALSNSTLGAGNPTGGTTFGAEAKAGSRAGTRASFGYFGFSTSLDLSARGRPDHTLVMRVRADRPALWRGQTFDVWDGRTWTISDQRTRTLEGLPPIDVPPPPENGATPTGDGQFVQTYYVAQPGPNLVFGAAPISKVYFPDRRVYELSDGTLRSGVEIGRGTVYTVVSQPATVGASALEKSDSGPAVLPPAITSRYAQPPVITPRVQDLARQATARVTTTYDKVIALEDAIATRTQYTLNAPPLPAGADAVDQFLFVDHRGFCEQIATSLTVMLRSLGVPARVAAGYAPGLRNPFTGLYEVRASDAHLWTEVWFPGIGWQSFDPTAVVPLAGDQPSYHAGTGLGAYLGDRLSGIPEWVEIAVLLVAGVAVVAGTVLPLAAAWVRRRRRPKPSWAESCLARLELAGAAQGRPRRANETVYEYVEAVGRSAPGSGHLDRVAAVVSSAAFSGKDVTDDDRRWVERALDEVTPSRRRRHRLAERSRSKVETG
ncbi:MAG TPA: transglutaminaseTgpA domain-containing protein [Acidimicrobiales bacterium]